jgi:glycerol-3-phosphate acyltransferase PlsY
MLVYPFWLLMAYLMGSINFAILVAYVLALPDPRRLGSQNPGATNMLRVGGKLPAVIVLLADVLKGWLPVVLASHWLDPVCLPNIALAAFLGHCYPVFFGFKGGKGVATAAGALLALSPVVWFFTLLTGVCIGYWRGYVSLASVVSAIVLPVYFHVFFDAVPWAILVLVFVLIWRHRQNVHRLIQNQEPQFKL